MGSGHDALDYHLVVLELGAGAVDVPDHPKPRTIGNPDPDVRCGRGHVDVDQLALSDLVTRLLELALPAPPLAPLSWD